MVVVVALALKRTGRHPRRENERVLRFERRECFCGEQQANENTWVARENEVLNSARACCEYVSADHRDISVIDSIMNQSIDGCITTGRTMIHGIDNFAR